MQGRTKGRQWLLILLLVPSVTGALWAQETSSLPASEAAAFLGDWTLHMDFQGRAVEMTLRIKDVEGNVAVTLESQRNPEPQVITSILKDGEDLKLEWERDFGGQTGTMVLEVALADDKLVGTLGDTGGFFSADVEAVREGEDASGTTATAASDSSDGDGARRRRRRGGATARLTLGGQSIEIGYAELKKDSEDYQTLAELEAGEVFTFVHGRSAKLKTETSLKFGDLVVKKGNAAENYPGVYSLWLKKAEDGWRLVFNEHADIWGSQHSSSADAGEVPIDRSDSDTDAETFKIELLEVGKGGILRFAWGPHQWLAPFEVVAD